MKIKKVIGLIPVRLKSKRLKEKPMLMIGNIPMFAHTYFRSKFSKLLDDLIVCCDDKKIFNLANKLKIKCILTSKRHLNGTERIYEAYKKIKTNYDLIIDIQGDEPLINPNQIDKLINFHKKKLEYDIVLPSTKISVKNKKSLVKVVKNKNNEVLYLSRLDIPFNSRISKQKLFKHSSIISFRPNALKKFVFSKPTILEKSENVELLRALEIGLKILSPTFKESGFSVDVKKDYQRALKSFSSDKLKMKYIWN